MGLVGGHDDHLPGGEMVLCSGDGYFRLTVEDLDADVVGGSVITQPLAGVEGEGRQGADLFVDQGPAHHRPFLVGNQLVHCQGLAGKSSLLFAHLFSLHCSTVLWITRSETTLPSPRKIAIDAGQGMVLLAGKRSEPVADGREKIGRLVKKTRLLGVPIQGGSFNENNFPCISDNSGPARYRAGGLRRGWRWWRWRCCHV